MKTAAALLIALAFCSCAKSGGISSIPPRHDTDRPWIEYRLVKLYGTEYIATRSHWPGGGEKWDLVGLKPSP